MRGHEDNGDLLLPGIMDEHPVSHLRASHDRHVDVQHDRIRQGCGSQEAQAICTVPRDANLVSQIAQDLLEKLRDVVVVINQQEMAHATKVWSLFLWLGAVSRALAEGVASKPDLLPNSWFA